MRVHSNGKGGRLKFRPQLLIYLIILACFSIISYNLGLNIGKQGVDSKDSAPKPVAVPSQVSDGINEAYRRCGSIPQSISVKRGHFTVVSGPAWSPDCRHLTWSVWESGTQGVRSDNTFAGEGLYLYTDKTEKINRVISRKSSSEIVQFVKWKDRYSIVYKVGDQEKIFEIE